MKTVVNKIVLASSLCLGVALTAAWVDGKFNAAEVRVNGAATGIRMHWTNGVLVVIGLRHFQTPDYPGFNFWHFPLTRSFTPHAPGFITDKKIADFGIIHWHDATQGAGHGFTLPLWFLVLLCMIMLPSVCIYRLRRPVEGQCAACRYDLRGTIAAGRTQCPECGAEMT